MDLETLRHYEQQVSNLSRDIPPILRPGVYDEVESLSALIERVSRPGVPIKTSDYINLVVKYTVGFIFPNEHMEPTSEKMMNHVLHTIGEVYGQTLMNEGSFSDPLEHQIYLTSYQLAMAGDIARSVAIMKDIVEREHSMGEEFIGLDLGAGSGILVLAQYIQARKMSAPRHRIIGIEGISEAARLANRILQSLHIGRVIYGNTAKAETYQELGIPPTRIDFISSENLPCPQRPFLGKDPISGKTYQEPQFANVQALRKHFQEEALKRCDYFPHIMSWSNFKSHTAINGRGDDGYGIDFARTVEEISTEKSISKDEPFYPTTIFPLAISQGTTEKIIPLEEVGKEYLITRSNPDGYIYPIESLQKRWHK